MFIKRKIPHHRLPSPNAIYVESAILSIDNTNISPLAIASIYVQNSPHADFTKEIEKIARLSSNIIICGDFNAKHKDWNGIQNQAGVELVKFATDHGFEINAPPTPTRFGRNTQNTIDLVIQKGFPYHCTLESLADLSSDHNPILCTFDVKVTMPSMRPMFQTNWEEFQKTGFGN